MPKMTDEDKTCDFLLNCIEHYDNHTHAIAGLCRTLGGKPKDHGRAYEVVTHWYAMSWTDPRWRAMRQPEPGDRTLRTWLRSLPTVTQCD